MPERKLHDKFLRLCASTTPLLPKLLKRMRSMVEADSYNNAYLLRVRATKMGESAPDGYTSLMVAAYANHIDAARLILEVAEEYGEAQGNTSTYADLHLDRDMFGMTALHIAGEGGHVEMIQFLLPLYKFVLPSIEVLVSPSGSYLTAAEAEAMGDINHINVPLVDLGGQTAFGRAVTSPIPKAKKNQRTLEKKLFSNNDLSIFGQAKPIGDRMGSIDGLGLEYGTSDMPGLRGYMENVTSVETWIQQGSCIANGEMALFAVCDGHGDAGRVSRFVASNASKVLQESIAEYELQNRDTKSVLVPSTEYWNAVWHSASLKLDRKLQEAHLTEGGSTGVFALITDQEIVVANVGDSRCILACKPIHDDEHEELAASDVAVGTTSSATNDDDTNESTDKSTEETTEESTTTTTTTTATTTTDNGTTKNTEEGPKTTTPMVVVTALSEDHKPNLPDEAARIRMAGFRVEAIPLTEEDGTETVVHKVVKATNEQLAVSRAFGDFDYKANTQLTELEQAVISLADVRVHTRRPSTDLYLVVACDGIWDVMENHEVIEVVQTQVRVKSKMSPNSLLPDVADVLLQECLGRDSRDNMSAILVSLQPQNNTNNNNNDEPIADATMPPKTLDFGSPT